jgi:hypothetical protein
MTSIHWPEPLPVDVLIKLNEVQAKMAIGLESKRGALRVLGEEFPNEKMAEIFEELRDDAFDQGALDLVRSQIQTAVMYMSGMLDAPPAEGGPSVTSAGGEDVSTTGSPGGEDQGILPGIDGNVLNKLVTTAYGTTLAQRRVLKSE